MRRLLQLSLLLLITMLQPPFGLAAQMDINTTLMRSTFKIAGQNSLGTAFVIGRPVPGEDKKLFFVLVTAAHVLRDIIGEQAILFLRKKEDNKFVKLPYQIQIRKGNEQLWKEHPRADVAVMYVRLPKEADIQLLPMSLLVS